ncbi:MAG: hypothetical protein ACOYCD_08760 [Kiritimatiellia bacterium]
MKNWRLWFYVMISGCVMLFGAGCESNSDETDVDDYFKNNEYQSIPRDTEDPLALEVTPAVAAVSIVGADVVFTAKGGVPSYKWRVSDKSKGNIVSVGRNQCRYVCLQVGNNTVRVEDQDGHFAVARVTPVQDVMAISPDEVKLVNEWEAAFTVTGGSPPYSWSAGNPAVGTVSFSAAASYQAAYHGKPGVFGVNVITVRDAEGRTASAVVTQAKDE